MGHLRISTFIFAFFFVFSAYAGYDDDLGMWASFTGSQTVLKATPDGHRVTLKNSVWMVPNTAKISTRGHSDFHVIFDGRSFGLKIVKAGTSEEKLLGKGRVFPMLKDDMTRFGVICDLRSPYSVVHYNRADTSVSLSFKVMEFTITKKFDGRATRYFRAFVAEDGSVIPLEVSAVPMRSLVPDSLSSDFEISEYLKKNVIRFSRYSNAEFDLSINTPRSLMVRTHAHDTLNVLNQGKTITIDEGYKIFEDFGPLKNLDVNPSVEEIKKDIARYTSDLTDELPKGEFGLPYLDGKPVSNTIGKLRVFERFKSLGRDDQKFYAQSNEIIAYKRAVDQAKMDAMLAFDSGYLPFAQTFLPTPENVEALRYMMDYLSTGLYQSSGERKIQTVFLDLDQVNEQNAYAMHSDYDQLSSLGTDFILVVANQKEIAIHYVVAGSAVPFTRYLGLNESEVCNRVLSGSVWKSGSQN